MNSTVTADLRALTASIERQMRDRLQPVGLTVPQMELLAVLDADPAHNGTSAARAAHVSPQTGTAILHNLAVKQLITVKHVSGTGRRNTITVTDAGRKALTQAREAVADVNERLAVLLGPEVVARIADN